MEWGGTVLPASFLAMSLPHPPSSLPPLSAFLAHPILSGDRSFFFLLCGDPFFSSMWHLVEQVTPGQVST